MSFIVVCLHLQSEKCVSEQRISPTFSEYNTLSGHFSSESTLPLPFLQRRKATRVRGPLFLRAPAGQAGEQSESFCRIADVCGSCAHLRREECAQKQRPRRDTRPVCAAFAAKAAEGRGFLSLLGSAYRMGSDHAPDLRSRTRSTFFRREG